MFHTTTSDNHAETFDIQSHFPPNSWHPTTFEIPPSQTNKRAKTLTIDAASRQPTKGEYPKHSWTLRQSSFGSAHSARRIENVAKRTELED